MAYAHFIFRIAYQSFPESSHECQRRSPVTSHSRDLLFHTAIPVRNGKDKNMPTIDWTLYAHMQWAQTWIQLIKGCVCVGGGINNRYISVGSQCLTPGENLPASLERCQKLPLVLHSRRGLCVELGWWHLAHSGQSLGPVPCQALLPGAKAGDSNSSFHLPGM